MHSHHELSSFAEQNGSASATGTRRANALFDQDGRLMGKASGVCCPSCHCELQIGSIEKCQFAGCPHCSGMMFQQEVFGMLIQHLRATKPGTSRMPEPMDTRQLKVSRLCPTCETLMETHPYGGSGNSVIDTCTVCGIVFLDQGELTKLVDAPGPR